MRFIVLALCIFCTLQSYAKPVTELVNIPYSIEFIEGYTAYSTGTKIVIGVELAKDLSEDMLGMVILHEAYHNVGRHSETLVDKALAECTLANKYTSTTEATICIDMYKHIHWDEIQRQERQTDYAAFKTAKKIGYTKEVCKVFYKLLLRYGEPPKYGTHPSFQSRYNKCREVLD